ncbi:MAG: sodium:proton antiporter [Ruminococcaceae bacterium]|nr:sodium:proton antiporter [Oscillospiraceae bacterium]
MRDFQILFTLALGLLAGLFMSRIVKPLKLPAVTGYLLAGILIGPYCLGSLGVTGLFTDLNELKTMAEIVQSVALGFIAFAIGTEFKLSSLKKTGKQATVVGIVQAVTAMLLVDAALIGLSFALGQDKLPLPVCVTLGAIATATAPAATLMVVKQYKAKGPLTNILLPVVALDDAVGLVCFAVSIGVAQALAGGGEALNAISLVINPLLEVVLSLILGAVMGAIFTVVENMFRSNSKRLCLSITFVLLTIALSQLSHTFSNGLEIKFSNLLVCMMLGTVFCNICDSAEELMEKTDKWTMPIFILFFVISGAELEFSFFKSWVVVLVGVIYVLVRALGKYVGAAFSAKITGCDKNIVKYLGVTLFPQAGVAIGMSILAVEALGSDGTTVRNIVLFGVLIYELVGPLLTKIALTKAGDIVPKDAPAEKHHLSVAEVFADDPDEDDE